jgi:hypothetical protein
MEEEEEEEEEEEGCLFNNIVIDACRQWKATYCLDL